MGGSNRNVSSSGCTSKENNDQRLEVQRWYHGFSTKEIVHPYLKFRGDYIVRATQKGDNITLTLNVRNMFEDKPIDALVITTTTDGKYILNALKSKPDAPSFETVPMLIHHYKRNELPNGIRLRRGVPRPRWMLSPDSIDFDPKDMLGSGNFCNVYKGFVGDKIPCAIKVMHKGLGKDPLDDLEKENEARDGMIREADLMASYRHENVIKFLGFACMRPPMMLVLELCTGGSLEDHLEKFGANCSDYERIIYLFETACGMRYLHNKKCIHRDLASRNCLISSKGIVKIADFGLSMTLKTGLEHKDHLSVLPLRWMAPEVLHKEQTFSFKTDVWAYGVLIFEVYNNGVRPWDDEKDDKKILKDIRKVNMPEAPKITPKSVISLMKTIWQKEPDDRPDFVEIVKKVADIGKVVESVPAEALTLNKIKDIQRTKLPNFESLSDGDMITSDKLLISDKEPEKDKIQIKHEGKIWIDKINLQKERKSGKKKTAERCMPDINEKNQSSSSKNNSKRKQTAVSPAAKNKSVRVDIVKSQRPTMADNTKNKINTKSRAIVTLTTCDLPLMTSSSFDDIDDVTSGGIHITDELSTVSYDLLRERHLLT